MSRSSASHRSFIKDEPSQPATELLPQQVRQQALKNPDSIALSKGTDQLTFAEFDRRGGLFAGYLRERGVLPGTAVALCMERSFEWIVAALGILRAGAAYVPLDSAWPAERLRYAIEDSGAVLLVSRVSLRAQIPMEVRGIDPWEEAAAIARGRDFFSEQDPEGLAYLIYTSGSTGAPKGVEITHANLAHLVRWHRSAFAVSPRDRVSHLAGLGFDAAVWEIWPNLAAGASLVLADETTRGSAAAIQEWLVRERITLSFVPTVHASALLGMTWPSDAALRCLLTGGDALPQQPPRDLRFRVVNNYGPTECTVVSTSTMLEPGGEGLPSIGRAIQGATIYLLDEERRPIRDGMPGEIYIGGDGVGRGYRKLKQATERSFLPDPFAGVMGARMFRTGDRGQLLRSGDIRFLGRIDRQVKIRGQRVELDEISHVLRLHPAVEFASVEIEAAAVGSEPALVGYVLPRQAQTQELGVHELQEHLSGRLPEYMIPAQFRRLKKLPLSPNGKIDLSLLPQTSETFPVERKAPEAPLSPVAETLLTMVRQILGNPEMTATSNFFLEGGHSLLATQLLLRLQSAFGIRLALYQLFESPTVVDLASVLEKQIFESVAAMSEEEAAQRLAEDSRT